MSSLPSVVALVGLGAISGWAYATHRHFPVKEESVINKERIHTLEEEIVRLKREMRICGIPIQSHIKGSPPQPPL
jgi:hypothetical protein